MALCTDVCLRLGGKGLGTYSCSFCRYLMARVYPTVFPAVCGAHRDQDRLYEERCRALRIKLLPKALDIPEDYHCTYPVTIGLLNTMDNLSSPLEKLYCIQDAMVRSLHVLN